MLVEKQLSSEGVSRKDLGRKKFIEQVWQWKGKYGGIIIQQLKRLGASCDWERERFTMDEGLSRAVREVFVRLHSEDLIYRDRYIVNWCPRCSTALSDLETVHESIQGRLYTIRYPATDGGADEIRVATTRPETLLAETVLLLVPGHHQLGGVRDPHVVRAYRNVTFTQRRDFAQGDDRVKRDPVADDVDRLVVQNPAGDQVQCEFLVTDLHGVPGIGAAAISRDIIATRRKAVHDLSFALVAPLQAHYCDMFVQGYILLLESMRCTTRATPPQYPLTRQRSTL